MQRRRYLAALSTVATVGLAGCGGEESPDNGESGTPTDTPRSTPSDGTPHSDAEEWHTTYRDALEAEGIKVDFSTVTNRRLVLDYNTNTTTRDALFEEATLVAETYANVLEPSWELDVAELWALDPEIDDPQNEAIMSYLVQTKWAREWKAGNLSDDEFINNVSNTAELYKKY
ncbi:MAG: hypothetical protein ACI80F_002364 [Natronomonas sp.]|jgi:hypothetical protein|uniref:hypothetical protein n=1 Tax=Natronomonas sp. TaxID=2184060 RepID=UPI00398965F6